MNDSISRKRAIDTLTTECSWTFYDEHGQLTHNGEEILGTLKKIPSVDAVEVVRCKDCKHRFNGEHHDNCCDVLMEKVKWTFEVTVEPDWFCADGELGRKERRWMI